MTASDEFLTWTQTRLREAETALHNGGEWKVAHRHGDTAESTTEG
jgi:hypothetical protein